MNNTVKGQPNSRKPLLHELSASVEQRYDEYNHKFNAHSLISISDCTRNDNESDALVYMYEGSSKIVSALKESIKNNQEIHLRQICPSCGLLPANTVDHYIPKELYPDFSIYSKNLIWTCATCNGRKLQYWKEPNYRGIINFYVDEIPTFNFINCDVKISNGILSAVYSLKEYKLTNYPNIVKHFDRLRVLDVYKEHMPSKLGEIVADLSSYKGKVNSKDVKRILLTQYFQRRRDFGVNDWKACLLREIITGKHYLQYI
ncbi:HNH endonuclease [Vibrio europaeus]|uniref:HNH endonuclease n=1 Tax=Vibrio europaeus TaxID=300876 RepID=UPI00233F1658|nr:HNH endonuclease signature motif containing protein [Vibrio europaeus]MDC5819503.1 HNH endonuclease [Vibrio europaeus]MDC5871945.1 HNH endonuclease [Vibrio europaeus]